MEPEVLAQELQKGLEDLKSLLASQRTKTEENEKAAKEHDQKITELTEHVENLKVAMTAMQVKENRPDMSGDSYQSAGSIFTDSANYKAMVDGGHDRCDKVEIKGGFQKHFQRRGMKDLTTTTGPNVVEQRVPGISPVRFETTRVRDLFQVFTTTSNAVEYIKEVRWNQLSSNITTLAAAAQPDIEVENINGYKPGATVTIDPAGVGTTETGVILSVTAAATGKGADPIGTITLTANLANAHAVGIEVVSDDFQFTPEASVKPTANAVFTKEVAAIKTLAHWLPATRQILEDAVGLRAHVDSRLLEGLALAEDKEILYGNNTANRLRGIIPDPDTQEYVWSTGVSGDEKIDAIRRAITLAQLAHYPVDGIIMHPTDWQDVQLTKGSDGHYIYASAPIANAPMTVWGIPVVVTTQIEAGTALLGAFTLGAALWDRMQSTIRVSEHHASFFVENMLAILAEERICLTLYRPESFVKVTFDAAP